MAGRNPCASMAEGLNSASKVEYMVKEVQWGELKRNGSVYHERSGRASQVVSTSDTCGEGLRTERSSAVDSKPAAGHAEGECLPPADKHMSPGQLLRWLCSSMAAASVLWSILRLCVRAMRLAFPDASVKRYQRRVPGAANTPDPNADSLPNAAAVAVCVHKFLCGRRSRRWHDAPPPPIELVQLLQTAARTYVDFVHRDMAETFMQNIWEREELDPDCLYEFSMLDPAIQPDPEPGHEHEQQPHLAAALVQDITAVGQSTLSGYCWLLELLGFASLKLVLVPAFRVLGFLVRAVSRVFA
eukprot:XP_001703491.1 predicted protein [Chlamydomonas reinhardtii]